MTDDEPGGLVLLAELERSGAITPTALVIDDPDFPFERWVALGAYFGEIKKRVSFYLGDWLNFGSSGVYEERYAQAMEVTGLNYETLTNYAGVCRRVARSRRRESLSFGHHQEVAYLAPAEQRHWLSEAEKNGWKRRELREALVRARDPEDDGATAVLPLSPLSPVATVEAASALATALETFEKVGKGEDVRRDLPRAVRALERAGETLRFAASVPSLVDVAKRVLADATLCGDLYQVSAPILDELRPLVLPEGGTE